MGWRYGRQRAVVARRIRGVELAIRREAAGQRAVEVVGVGMVARRPTKGGVHVVALLVGEQAILRRNDAVCPVQLGELRDSGVLTADEFEREKTRVLAEATEMLSQTSTDDLADGSGQDEEEKTGLGKLAGFVADIVSD